MSITETTSARHPAPPILTGSGAILASLLVGMVEALATGYLSATYSSAIAYLAIVAVLLIRPSGIFEAPVEVESETL